MEKLRIVTEDVLFGSDGRKATSYATSGKYPIETTSIDPAHIDRRGAWIGRIGYSDRLGHRVVQLIEKVQAVLVFWKCGGDLIKITCPEHQLYLEIDYSDKVLRNRVAKMLGDPKRQAKLYLGGWQYLREISNSDLAFLKSK